MELGLGQMPPGIDLPDIATRLFVCRVRALMMASMIVDRNC